MHPMSRGAYEYLNKRASSHVSMNHGLFGIIRTIKRSSPFSTDAANKGKYLGDQPESLTQPP